MNALEYNLRDHAGNEYVLTVDAETVELRIIHRGTVEARPPEDTMDLLRHALPTAYRRTRGDYLGVLFALRSLTAECAWIAR